MFKTGFKNNSGDVLLFRTVSHTVSLAMTGLTALFEMGRGVTLSLMSPEILKLDNREDVILESLRCLMKI